jgi:hypothetical protein
MQPDNPRFFVHKLYDSNTDLRPGEWGDAAKRRSLRNPLVWQEEATGEGKKNLNSRKKAQKTQKRAFRNRAIPDSLRFANSKFIAAEIH